MLRIAIFRVAQCQKQSAKLPMKFDGFSYNVGESVRAYRFVVGSLKSPTYRFQLRKSFHTVIHKLIMVNKNEAHQPNKNEGRQRMQFALKTIQVNQGYARKLLP